ncbi:MAG: hypothetical protein ACRC2R_22005 [Xenococcaceae cyanobacterium]
MSEVTRNNLVELSEEQLDEVAGGTYHYKPSYDHKKTEYKKDCCPPKKEYNYDKKYGC